MSNWEDRIELYSTGSPISFTEFVEFMGVDADPEVVDQHYESYKKKFLENSFKIFFKDHSNKQWFKELYFPSKKKERDSQLRSKFSRNLAKFQEDLSDGKFNQIVAEKVGNIVASTEDVGDEVSESQAQFESLKSALAIPYRTELVFMGSIEADVSREDIEEALSLDPDFEELLLNPANPRKGYRREALVALKPGSDIYSFLKRNQYLRVGKFEFLPVKDEYTFRKFHYAPSVASTEPRLRKDLIQCSKIALKFEEWFGIEKSPISEITPVKFESLESIDKQVNEASIDDVKYALDLTLIYLRRVYWFCYYHGYCYIFDSAEIFVRRCGEYYLRHISKSIDEEREERSNENWVKNVDSTAQKILSQVGYSFLEKAGYEEPETAVEKWMVEHILKVDENKFRCLVPECGKLFKGEDFLRKHFRNRHPDIIGNIELNAEYYGNYLKDPLRLQLSDLTSENKSPRHSRPRNSNRRVSFDRDFRRGYGGYRNTHRGYGTGYVDLDAMGGSQAADSNEEISYE